MTHAHCGQIALLADGDSFGVNAVITATIVCNRSGSEVLVLPVEAFRSRVQPYIKATSAQDEAEMVAIFRKRCVRAARLPWWRG